MSHPLNVLDPIDDLTPTDLWSDIEHRRAGPEPEPPASPSRRMTVIAVAFLIAAVTIAIPIVVITQTPDPIPFQEQVGRQGASRNPMGIPITVTYPPEWYARNVLQPASLDDNVDGGRQVGLVISNTQEAMPTVSLESGSADGAGPLPDDPNLPPTFVTVTILTDKGRPGSWMDSSLPLSMDDGKVAPGAANIRSLDAQIGGVPLTITVQGGPRASAADLVAAEEIVGSIRPDGVTDGFGFAPTSGWYEMATDDLAAGDAANVAWASTLPFREEDQSFANEGDGVLGRWSEPSETIEGLSADDAVIVVIATTYGEPFPAQPNTNFPAADSIALPASPTYETEWEGHGDTGISRVRSLSEVNGWLVEVHAYFGTAEPSSNLVDAVGAQLAAFDLPAPSDGSGPGNEGPVVVPNVVGQNFLTALGSTTGFRLRDVEYRETSKAENGTILEQEPPAGSSADQADGIIRVVVAARPRGPLLGTEWVLDYLDGRSMASPGPDVTLQFRPLRLVGFGGCNGYSARYEMQGRKVVVRGLTSTLIGCSGERGQIEARLFEILRASPVAMFDATKLRLTALPEGVATFTAQS